MKERIIHWKDLLDFSKRVMMQKNVSAEDAEKVADNLVLSNLRGIDSHGVARLKRYVDGIDSGFILPDVRPETVKESSVMANVDGKNGLGQVAGTFAMELAIKKAKKEGLSLVTVFNSNHYGFAGYYPLMALKEDLMGISMTNSAPLSVPTFGKNALIGTNPIAVSAPTGTHRPWVMDFATSVVPRGKVEVYNRLGKELPEGWATDENGHVTREPARVLNNLKDLLGGGLLPLGGAGELYGGHKGYGLMVMVDIFSAVLSGSNFAKNVVNKKDGKTNFPRVGHMFMAINPEFLVGLEAFKSHMDTYIDMLINSQKAEGEERIYVHGEKEFEEHDRREKNGIPLDAVTVERLTDLGKQFDEKIKFMD